MQVQNLLQHMVRPSQHCARLCRRPPFLRCNDIPCSVLAVEQLLTLHTGIKPCFCAMQTDRFTLMSSNILGRIDELGTRIDELEKQIEDMMVQSSPNEGSPSKMGQH